MSGADVAIRSSERADGKLSAKTEIVHVVGECEGSVPVGHCVAGHRFLPEEMETGRRTACASDRRAWIRQMIGLFLNIGRAC